MWPYHVVVTKIKYEKPDSQIRKFFIQTKKLH